jgi:hypothetical protein
MKLKHSLLAVCTLLVGSGSASAAMWIESSQGDMLNSGLTPSTLTLDAGSNLIRGSFRAEDPDYLAITIAGGYMLSGIITGTGNSTGLSRSFIGVQAGPAMTFVPTSGGSAAGLLGWTHYGVADGVNLLPDIGTPKFGSTGFSGPLAAGTYTFWFNETSSEPGLGYDFDFQVEPAPVPLPAGAALLAAGCALLGALRRRRSLLV